MIKPTEASILPKITLVVLVIIIGFAFGLLYWLFWPIDVMTISKLDIVDRVAYSGSYLIYKMEYCKSREYGSIPGLVQYEFYEVGSGLSYAALGQRLNLIPTGCSTITDALRVPVLPAGKYKVGMIRTYRVNPVRDVVVRALSASFDIEIPKAFANPQ